MRKHFEGHVFPSFKLRPNRTLAAQYLESQGAPADASEVPPTYMIFLRAEAHGIDPFENLDIPRRKALHGGQRYEWFAPIGCDDELEVSTRVERVTEKTGKAGTLWFVDVVYDYRLLRNRELALRETSRLIKRGGA